MLRVSALDFNCASYALSTVHREKKINIAFESIWFRFNFSSFFSTFLIDTLFDKTHAWATIGWIQKKTSKKRSVSKEVKRIRENVVVIRYLVVLVHAFSTFRGTNKFNKQDRFRLSVMLFFISQWKMQFCSWCSFNCNLYEQRQRQQQNEYTQHDNNHFCNRISTPHLFTHALQIDSAQTEYKHKNGSPVSVKTKCVTVLHGL